MVFYSCTGWPQVKPTKSPKPPIIVFLFHFVQLTIRLKTNHQKRTIQLLCSLPIPTASCSASFARRTRRTSLDLELDLRPVHNKWKTITILTIEVPTRLKIMTLDRFFVVSTSPVRVLLVMVSNKFAIIIGFVLGIIFVCSEWAS